MHHLIHLPIQNMLPIAKQPIPSSLHAHLSISSIRTGPASPARVIMDRFSGNVQPESTLIILASFHRDIHKAGP